MVESLLGEFPLRGWRTYLLTCLIMEISERDSEAIQILDMDVDTQSKESQEINDIDATPEKFKPSKYKIKRAVFLNHCIKKIMISKEIRCENKIHDVILELDRSCLTMKWYTVYFLDHIANVIVFTYEAISNAYGT